MRCPECTDPHEQLASLCGANGPGDCMDFGACRFEYDVVACQRVHAEARAADAHHDATDSPRTETVFTGDEEDRA